MGSDEEAKDIRQDQSMESLHGLLLLYEGLHAVQQRKKKKKEEALQKKEGLVNSLGRNAKRTSRRDYDDEKRE